MNVARVTWLPRAVSLEQLAARSQPVFSLPAHHIHSHISHDRKRISPRVNSKIRSIPRA